jgi:hypothetical protein
MFQLQNYRLQFGEMCYCSDNECLSFRASHTVMWKNETCCPAHALWCAPQTYDAPVRYDHDVWASNVVMWTIATPCTRDAISSALGLYAVTLSSKLEDYCFSELLFFSELDVILCRPLLVESRLWLWTQFTTKELYNVLYLLYKTPTCFGHISCHLQGVTSLVDVYNVYGNLPYVNGGLYIIYNIYI